MDDTVAKLKTHLTRVANEMISAFGSFLPIGAYVSRDRSCVDVPGYSPAVPPDSAAVTEKLIETLRRCHTEGGVLAVGVGWAAELVNADAWSRQSQLRLHIEFPDSRTIEIDTQYVRDANGKVEWRESVTRPGRALVFVDLREQDGVD